MNLPQILRYMKTYIKKCQVCDSEFETTNGTVVTCGKTCSYKLRNKTRRIEHAPITKTCAVCSEEFQDTSKKKQVMKCSACIQTGMVATRMANGSYVRTDEQNAKMVASMQAVRDAGGGQMSDETKQRMSEDLASRWKSEEFREKVKQGYITNHGTEHWTQTATAKKLLAVRGRKLKHTEKTKRKMRVSAGKRIREGRQTHAYLGRGGIRADLGFYVRSSWEANFARYLLHEGKAFEYEPDSFVLKNGRTYTPDFKVADSYYEVKGWWTPQAKEKFANFKNEYPDIRIEIVDEFSYNDLCGRYSSIIQNWEDK
jgi:hypothetical protein